ncbi:MAG: 3-isopropylmalate dehydratase large subunit [Spirochaetes bacterium]|nr:3-isopropylmalate dehydratase large subunit [Spirochaetota bacterium]
MGMTLAEKILAAKSNKKNLIPGEFIEASIDVALGNDITAPLAIKEFERTKTSDVWDRSRIVLVADHFTPNKDIKSAIQSKVLRDFARKYNIIHFFDTGRVGIEHVLLPEQGLVLPGDLVIGADSHTCTYGALGAFATGVGSTDLAASFITGKVWLKVPESMRFIYFGKRNPWVSGKDLILYTIGKIGVDGATYKAMYFTGQAVKELSMADRFTMSNMAIEAGGKAGLFDVDKKTQEYIKKRAKRDYKVYTGDEDASYCDTIEIDVSGIEPQVAKPHLPENTVNVREIGNIAIDQAVIGSCTNGRLEDLRIAAKIFKGRKVNKNVRVIILPGTQEICKQAVKEGLVEIFLDAGVAFSTPTCGPCLGGHMGILAPGERAISTTNRNFVGRMGHIQSEVYLAGVAVAAASAVAGKIVHPDDI